MNQFDVPYMKDLGLLANMAAPRSVVLTLVLNNRTSSRYTLFRYDAVPGWMNVFRKQEPWENVNIVFLHIDST